MARNPETAGYVSWSDVMETWRYLEAGYNVTIVLSTVCNCPQGHQYSSLCNDLYVFEKSEEPVPLPRRISRRYPTVGRETMPGLLLGLLYELDAALSEVRVFAESPIAVKPRRERAATA